MKRAVWTGKTLWTEPLNPDNRRRMEELIGKRRKCMVYGVRGPGDGPFSCYGDDYIVLETDHGEVFAFQSTKKDENGRAPGTPEWKR